MCIYIDTRRINQQIEITPLKLLNVAVALSDPSKAKQ